MKIVRIVTIAALALLLASCCACRKGSKNDKPLAGTKWTLIEMAGKPVIAGEGYHITFDDKENRFHGVGDCNRISGAYSLKPDGKIALSSVISTRMMCPNQAQEGAFLQTLEQADSYRIDKDLMLLLRNGEILAIMQGK